MVTRKKAKADKKPTMTSLLAQAGAGYAKTVKGLVIFCTAYVKALELYGNVGKQEFAKKYALYSPSDWETFEDIGRGRLLPQFAFCSGNMKRGLLRLENSLDKQLKLIGCVEGGKVETIDAKGKIVLKSLEELSKLEEDSILFALGEGCDPKEIRKFARDYRVEFALKANSKPNIELVGDYLVIHRKTKLSKQEVQQWLSRM
jgi:hypothetical protein